MTALPQIQRFTTRSGIRIYRIPVEAFPNFLIVYCYVLLEAGEPMLIDTGSGLGVSTDQLLAGIASVRDDFGEALALTDIRRILITHGHIDHFGGVATLQELTGAQVAIHALDRRILTNNEERVVIATKDLKVYLERAGVKPSQREQMLQMYGFTKKHLRSVKVDFPLAEDTSLDGLRFVHTPGHCSGQVCIIVDEVMITADHILARITPHQAPESITHSTGLGHYLDSLAKVEQIDGIELGMGGHEEPIPDIYQRIPVIRASHLRKLDRILDILRAEERPITISAISKHLYPDRHGYDILLALEETGAHVEYLYHHGMLGIGNLEEVEREDNPALLYGLA